ncbi:hypothetical protein V8E55_007238 [Tylopilus felleus]
MDRHPSRFIEQLHNAQARQRKVIQQLHAENARRLADLADVRQERDVFRREAARLRKENAELRNRLEEMMTECQDSKRAKAALTRSLVAGGDVHGQNAHLGFKMLNTLSVLNEEQPMSPETTETSTTMEQAACAELEAYLQRDLPDPPKSDSPRPDHPASNVVLSEDVWEGERVEIDAATLAGDMFVSKFSGSYAKMWTIPRCMLVLSYACRSRTLSPDMHQIAVVSGTGAGYRLCEPPVVLASSTWECF